MRWFHRPFMSSDVTADPSLSESSPVIDLSHEERVALAAIEYGSAEKTPLLGFLCSVHDMLRHSPAGQDLFHQAADRGYGVQLMAGDSDTIDLDAERRVLYLPDYNLDAVALIRSPYFRTQMTINLIRGLRLIDQQERGATITTHRPDQALLFSRAMAADAWAIAIWIAYDLRHHDVALWRHMLGSNAGDLAIRFVEGVERNPRGIPMASRANALRAAFLAWYRDQSRVDTHDHMTLDALDDRINSFTARPLMKARVTPDQYRELTQMPLGFESYLDTDAISKLKSPDCQNIDDATNAAHLQHVLRDLQAYVVQNVPFRDKKLAALIFPDQTD